MLKYYLCEGSDRYVILVIMVLGWFGIGISVSCGWILWIMDSYLGGFLCIIECWLENVID